MSPKLTRPQITFCSLLTLLTVLCLLPLTAAGGDKPKEYTHTLRVIQMEQVPYVVQTGGGSVQTNCNITGSTYTTGMATTSGNVTFGTANSNSDLRMDCNSYQTQPMRWRHVLSAMLVEASDGNAYIIACDAAWRWSKCVGLRPGQTFNARQSGKGFFVQYATDKGKVKEAEYTVLQAKSLR